MAATEEKKFSTRREISGVSAPAITGGSAGRFSEAGIVTASLRPPPVFYGVMCLITEFIGQNKTGREGHASSVAIRSQMKWNHARSASSELTFSLLPHPGHHSIHDLGSLLFCDGHC